MTRRIRIVGDVSELADYGYGPQALGWWGVLGFVLIEGMAFVLVIGAYLYLLPFEAHWPPALRPPDLRYGTLFTILMLASVVPNHMIKHAARREDETAVRRLILVMIAFGIALLIVRVFEFTALNTRWDLNAYGSIVWAIMVIHTIHLATDFYDTCPLAVLVHVRGIDGRHFSDVEDNAVYWDFVAFSWLVLYVLIYWLPRMLS